MGIHVVRYSTLPYEFHRTYSTRGGPSFESWALLHGPLSVETNERYGEGWIAHVIQKPWIKTCVLYGISSKPGMGKDLTSYYLRQVLGDNNSADPEWEIWIPGILAPTR